MGDKIFPSHHFIKNNRTFGQKAADTLTKCAGSWKFIIIFAFFLIFWISLNGYFLIKYLGENAFDPYPFILLNLVLSCLAAIQAPIILMSQNREEEITKQRLEYDYAVNRKAEREIEQVKEKLDRIEKMLFKKK